MTTNKEKQPPPSYADTLAVAGCGLIAYGLALAWPPACYLWLGAAAIAAAYIRAKNRAAALARARYNPQGPRP